MPPCARPPGGCVVVGAVEHERVPQERNEIFLVSHHIDCRRRPPREYQWEVGEGEGHRGGACQRNRLTKPAARRPEIHEACSQHGRQDHRAGLLRCCREPDARPGRKGPHPAPRLRPSPRAEQYRPDEESHVHIGPRVALDLDLLDVNGADDRGARQEAPECECEHRRPPSAHAAGEQGEQTPGEQAHRRSRSADRDRAGAEQVLRGSQHVLRRQRHLQVLAEVSRQVPLSGVPVEDFVAPPRGHPEPEEVDEQRQPGETHQDYLGYPRAEGPPLPRVQGSRRQARRSEPPATCRSTQ